MPYVANRYLTVDGKIYAPGEVVPGAENWLRLESRINTGRLRWIDEPFSEVEKKNPAKKTAAKKAIK